MAATKATTRPTRPTIDAVQDNVPPYTGSIPKDGLTNDPRPTVSGRGDAGSTIHILVDGKEVGTVVVGSNGAWSFALPQALRDGEYRLTARASNEIGMSVPSTSYGIQVDTTPPSQPKVESATEGLQPVLSGRAEAYSTVTVYEGAKELGTTTAKEDGTWTFQMPVKLSSGSHSVTVKAMDPAGNTSVASAGYDVVVAPSAPLAQAVLDEMGRDSGSFNFDRLTNDGTAGRLLTGRVSAALAVGEKVQVSTDGGRTWQDAVMQSDGKWGALDAKAHADNWTIQTRVVNTDGIAGKLSSYDVVLDTTAPEATHSAVRTGNAIDVAISATGAVAGDMINVLIGDQRIAYHLTAADITSGKATVNIPANIAATMDAHTSYGVALVDQSGNISDYLVTRYVEVNSGSGSNGGIDYKIVDFNQEKPRDLNANGIPVDFGIFSVVLPKTNFSQGIRVAGGGAVAGGIKPETGETGLLMGVFDSKFYLNSGAHAQALNIDVGFASSGSLNSYRYSISFMNDNGVEVYRYQLSDSATPLNEIHSYHIVLPDQLQFSSFSFKSYRLAGEGYPDQAIAWIDNVGFAGASFGQIVPDAIETFNNERPRDLGANGIPVDFGIFSVVLPKTNYVQGIRVAGGGAVAGGIKPETGETGLLMGVFDSKFYLNNGAHAQALNIDVGFAPSARLYSYRYSISFMNDNGVEVYRYQFSDSATPLNDIHSYHIVLPDQLQFSSFSFMSYRLAGEGYSDQALAWIDNVAFSGGSFTKATWETITELVPPANVQHVSDTADAAYYGAAGGSEFQVDHVSYFSGGNSGIHGGAGIDTLKLTGAGQVLDLSTLLNVDGHDKLSSIEIVDITGTGNNTLKLSMSDVLTLGHEDLFRTDGHTQMIVKGNAGDVVQLTGMSGVESGDWTAKGSIAIGGAAYTVYENVLLNVELLVQSAVKTQLV